MALRRSALSQGQKRRKYDNWGTEEKLENRLLKHLEEPSPYELED
jgi:hypothetical protein